MNVGDRVFVREWGYYKEATITKVIVDDYTNSTYYDVKYINGEVEVLESREFLTKGEFYAMPPYLRKEI